MTRICCGRLTAGLAEARDRRRGARLVIRGAGKHFQAGADINWLNRAVAPGPGAELHRIDGDHAGQQTLNELPEADDRGGAWRVFRRRRRHRLLRRCGVGDAGRAVRDDRGAGRRRADADLDAHGERDRLAADAPLRADRRAVRCRRGAAHRPGARGGAGGADGGEAGRGAGGDLPERRRARSR